MSGGNKRPKEPSYGEASARLEEILVRIEEGQVDIDELSGLVAEAAELVTLCRTKIQSAEAKQVITKYRAGQHGMVLLYWSPDYFDPHANASTFARNPDKPDAKTFTSVASRNGWVIPELTAETDAARRDDNDGITDSYDVDGDNLADGAVDGLTDATKYEPGGTFWRVPVSHFTPYDFNWPYGPPADSIPPNPSLAAEATQKLEEQKD